MIDELPEVPDPAIHLPTQFSQIAAALVLAQKAMVPQINAAIAQFNAISAGGAYALPYVFDTAITDADPGAGKLRLSSATQNAATVMRLDLTAGGQDYTTLLDTFDASTSAVKGTIRLTKFGDLTKWMTFDVTARAAPSGYRNLTVVCTDSSSASPFANGDGVLLHFQRTGDKGDTGATGANGSMNLLGTATVGAAVANIDFLNVFTSTYDKYTIEVQGAVSSGGDALAIRLAYGGVVSSSANYTGFAGNGGSGSTTQSQLTSGAQMTSASSFTIEVRDVNAARFKGVGIRGLANGGAPAAVSLEGGQAASSAASGFRLFLSSGGNFTSGTVRVYGHRNI